MERARSRYRFSHGEELTRAQELRPPLLPFEPITFDSGTMSDRRALGSCSAAKGLIPLRLPGGAVMGGLFWLTKAQDAPDLPSFPAAAWESARR
jgi:hypothetical protein